jgi:hypothetical protein
MATGSAFIPEDGHYPDADEGKCQDFHHKESSRAHARHHTPVCFCSHARDFFYSFGGSLNQGIRRSPDPRAPERMPTPPLRPACTFLALVATTNAFHIPTTAAMLRCSLPLVMSEKPPPAGANLGSKAVWFATEAFGNLAALGRSESAAESSSRTKSVSPTSVDDAIRRLRADYAGTPNDPRPYFLTGKMDVALYDEQCVFADPFVSFSGRDRFVSNLENLAGGFITESSTRELASEAVPGDATAGVPPTYTTKLLVKLRLALPWSPVLAWPWGVEHVFDPESGLIIRHIESWDVSPAEGVRQLFSGGADKRI